MRIGSLLRDFRTAPVGTLARLQDERALWVAMAAISLFMVILAHSLFQNYLYMRPCEQCVYIRFAFFVMAAGGVVAAIQPRNPVLKVAGYAAAGWGAWIGMGYSLKLDAIHRAAHSDNPFGVQGCSAEPTFPFGLPLDKWSPGWFKPTGDCGFDNPIIPEGAQLDALQAFLTNFYADGWYIWPPAHFGNMAQAMIVAYGVTLLLLAAAFAAWTYTAARARRDHSPFPGARLAAGGQPR